jgi:hypothetical protein
MMTQVGPDFDLDKQIAQTRAQLEKFEEFRDRFGAVIGRGEAANGHVRVEVGPTGGLNGLVIDPRAMRLGSDELAAEIRRAAAAAAADSARQCNELLVPFLGAGGDHTALLQGRIEGSPAAAFGDPGELTRSTDPVQAARDALEKLTSLRA